MERIYEQFVAGDTRITIYHDELTPHPWSLGLINNHLANWEEDEYCGYFTPYESENDEEQICESKEEFREWLARAKNPVVFGIRWFDKYGGLVLDEDFDIDDESFVGALYANGTEIETIKEHLRHDFQILNAYISDCVFCFVLETRTSLSEDKYYELMRYCEKANQGKFNIPSYQNPGIIKILKSDQWIVQDACTGFYHNMEKDGNEDLYLRMSDNWPNTPDVIEIKKQMGIYDESETD